MHCLLGEFMNYSNMRTYDLRLAMNFLFRLVIRIGILTACANLFSALSFVFILHKSGLFFVSILASQATYLLVFFATACLKCRKRIGFNRFNTFFTRAAAFTIVCQIGFISIIYWAPSNGNIGAVISLISMVMTILLAQAWNAGVTINESKANASAISVGFRKVFARVLRYIMIVKTIN